MSVCAAISRSGPIHFTARFGPFNTQNFLLFLDELKKKLAANDRKKVIVMDNVAFHKTELVRSWFKENSLSFLYLPPYSPMLNPIEECFSKVKHLIRMAESSSNNHLMRSIEQAFESVSASDCEGWYRHMKSFFPQCFESRPILCEVDSGDTSISDYESEDEILGEFDIE